MYMGTYLNNRTEVLRIENVMERELPVNKQASGNKEGQETTLRTLDRF